MTRRREAPPKVAKLPLILTDHDAELPGHLGKGQIKRHRRARKGNEAMMLVEGNRRIVLGVHHKCECSDPGAVCPGNAVDRQARAYSFAAMARGNGEPANAYRWNPACD